jgi:hypothetical protein
MKTHRSTFVRFFLDTVSSIALTTALTATAQTGPTLPVVTVRAPDPSASEDGDPGRFVLVRQGPTNLALNVYCLLRGTASNGVDYATIPSFIPIPAGVRETPVLVSPIDDPLSEGPETVELQLAPSPLLGPVNYLIGDPSNAVVILYDNDPPPTNLPPQVRIVSPANGAVFDPPANPLICAEARDADGYVEYVEFFADNLRLGARTNCLPCASLQNPFCLVWTNAPPGDHVLTARATDNQGATAWSDPVFIRVGPPPVPPVVNLAASDPIASEIPEVPPWLDLPQRVDPATFTVWRSGGTNLPLTVYYTVGGTASNGVDYVKLPGSVTIPAGAYAARIEVLPIDDLLVEGTETVVLTLAPVACITLYPPPPDCYQVGPSNQATAYILDNDPETNRPPLVRILKPLDGQTFVPPTNVVIVADTVDPDGYVPHVDFYADDDKIGEQTVMFFVPPPPGQHTEFRLAWTNPPAGRHTLTARATDNQGVSAVSDPVVIWVVNTNPPPPPPVVTITAVDPIAAEGTNCWRWAGWSNTCAADVCRTNTATFLVRRSGPTNDALTVWYRIGGTASNGVDYLALPGNVTIPAGERAAPIVVVPLDDNLPEKLETVVLRLLVPPAMTAVIPPYVIGWPARAAAIIVDNDQPRPLTGTLPDRCFHLMRPGANGTWWRIECSSDLTHWTPLGTNQVTDGALHFVDPDADELPARFYRAVPESPPPPE